MRGFTCSASTGDGFTSVVTNIGFTFRIMGDAGLPEGLIKIAARAAFLRRRFLYRRYLQSALSNIHPAITEMIITSVCVSANAVCLAGGIINSILVYDSIICIDSPVAFDITRANPCSATC